MLVFSFFEEILKKPELCDEWFNIVMNGIYNFMIYFVPEFILTLVLIL